MAAAFCLSPQAAFASTTADGTAAHAPAVTIRDYQPGAPLAELMSATRPAVPQHKSQQKKSSSTTWYTVKSGDSLSAIATHVYNEAAAWPVLYWGNKDQIRSADLILPGQRLRVPAKPARIPAAPAAAPVTAPAAAPAVAQASVAPASQSYTSAQPASTVYHGSGSSFQQCVIARESGGNSQVMNSSGHYGLYQFSASTWAAYGGSPADFGHASVAEQNRVFSNAIAAGGQSNWSPYDGC